MRSFACPQCAGACRKPTGETFIMGATRGSEKDPRGRTILRVRCPHACRDEGGAPRAGGVRRTTTRRAPIPPPRLSLRTPTPLPPLSTCIAHPAPCCGPPHSSLQLQQSPHPAPCPWRESRPRSPAPGSPLRQRHPCLRTAAGLHRRHFHLNSTFPRTRITTAKRVAMLAAAVSPPIPAAGLACLKSPRSVACKREQIQQVGINSSLEVPGVGGRHSQPVRRNLDRFAHMKHVLSLVPESLRSGLHLEFGVRDGEMLRYAAGLTPNSTAWHGFDSWAGLPDSSNTMRGHWAAGVYATGMPTVPANVRLHQGWFNETLASFLDAHRCDVAFVHIDSDIYDSALCVLTKLFSRCRVRAGTLVAFDEIFGTREVLDHEYKALLDATTAFGVGFEWASYAIVSTSSFSRASVRITSVGERCTQPAGSPRATRTRAGVIPASRSRRLHVDWSRLDTRGYVHLPGFLGARDSARIVAHWKTTAQKNTAGKSSSYAQDVPEAVRLKARLGQLAWEIASSPVTGHTPDASAVNCSDYATYFHMGGFDGAAAERLRGSKSENGLPLHIDRNTLWEYVGNNSQIGFLNFYMPLAKSHERTGNLRVLPFHKNRNSILEELRGVGARYFPSGPSRADVAVAVTGEQAVDPVMTEGRIESVMLPGKSMWCPQRRVNESRQQLRFQEPHTAVGDLLIVRADVIHMSGPSDSFRLAMSVRMWDHLPTTAELTRARTTAGCGARRALIDAALKVPEPRACTVFNLDPRQ